MPVTSAHTPRLFRAAPDARTREARVSSSLATASAPGTPPSVGALPSSNITARLLRATGWLASDACTAEREFDSLVPVQC